jgi:hypothetical protein
MFEFCYSNEHNVITVFRRTFLCLAFMFLISLMICVSRNLRNALSWHRSRWKNSDNKSVGVNRFLLRSSIKARHRVCKRGQSCLQDETFYTIHDRKQAHLITNFIKQITLGNSVTLTKQSRSYGFTISLGFQCQFLLLWAGWFHITGRVWLSHICMYIITCPSQFGPLKMLFFRLWSSYVATLQRCHRKQDLQT